MDSKYLLIETTKTRCPNCRDTVTLLQHAEEPTGKPQFYICFACFGVYEVGVGDVHYAED